jgi:hypothetical protein
MPGKIRTRDEIIAEQKQECSFFDYGFCSTRACLMGRHPNRQFTGCLAYQTVLALKGEPIEAVPYYRIGRPRTEDEANEAADNGRNTGGKSYPEWNTYKRAFSGD